MYRRFFASCAHQASVVHVVGPSEHSAPNHPTSPSGSVCFPPDADLASRQRILGSASTRQARHDVRPNRVPLVRTTRSPPVAPHAPSRRRSYLRLQGPDRILARTSTSLNGHAPGCRSIAPLTQHKPSLPPRSGNASLPSNESVPCEPLRPCALTGRELVTRRLVNNSSASLADR